MKPLNGHGDAILHGAITAEEALRYAMSLPVCTTITGIDKAGHTVTVKTDEGSEETYHIAKDAAVDTEHGAVKGTEYTAKKGEKVSVHYTDEAGKKVAHFIKHF